MRSKKHRQTEIKPAVPSFFTHKTIGGWDPEGTQSWQVPLWSTMPSRETYGFTLGRMGAGRGVEAAVNE